MKTKAKTELRNGFCFFILIIWRNLGSKICCRNITKWQDSIIFAKKQDLRSTTLFLFLLYSLTSFGQDSYTYQLELNDSTQILEGHLSINISNQKFQNQDSLYLHLPPRAMSWRGSFLQKQFIDFQNVRLYYAEESKKGAIEISNSKINESRFEACVNCEYTSIPLEVEKNESSVIELDFKILLPDAAFTGIGYDGEVFRIIDWLPRLAAFSNGGWSLNPVTFQSDWFRNKDEFKVTITTRTGFKIASNIDLIEENEIGNDKRESTFYSKASTNLQFYISKHFKEHQINEDVKLYTTFSDPYLPGILPLLDQKVNVFLEENIGSKFKRKYSLVILKKKIGEFQSDGVLSFDYPKSTFDFSARLIHARAEQLFRYDLTVNGFQDVWLARGIPYFFKYEFIKSEYPDKKWIPLENWQLLGEIFDLDAFDYGYQNQFLLLYISRQGLDQAMSTPADSLSRLNYEAITQAKSYLALSHLKAYAGRKQFRRSMNKFWVEGLTRKTNRPEDLKKAFSFFVFRDVDWFFNTLIKSNKEHDYQILETDYCPTISTATIRNKKSLAIPYSLTGIKDNEVIITEWFDGHEGKKTVQMYHDRFDKVVINYHQTAPEFSQKNNSIRTSGLFKRAEPLRLQFFNSFENPNKSQVYWMPAFNYNNYDKLLLSVQLHNRSVAFVRKPFEYRIEPEYSTGTNSLTGSVSSLWNFTPSAGAFHRVSTGFYGRYNHYDEDLAFIRFSPSLNFFFRRKYAETKVLQKLRFRGIILQREQSVQSNDTDPQSRVFDGFSLASATYTIENINLLKPYTIVGDFQIAEQFTLLNVTTDFRKMLPNKHWLIWRNYAGVFLKNNVKNADGSPNFFSLGMSGTQDYLFDYNLLGRSEESGLWSQQFFTTDGGFKSSTNIFANDFLLASNLSLPLWTPFRWKGVRPSVGLFGDVGVADNFDQLYWDYGIRISVFTDFLELYLPIQNSQTNFLTETAYPQRVRFVFNLDPSEIIERIRRGYY